MAMAEAAAEEASLAAPMVVGPSETVMQVATGVMRVVKVERENQERCRPLLGWCRFG